MWDIGNDKLSRLKADAWRNKCMGRNVGMNCRENSLEIPLLLAHEGILQIDIHLRNYSPFLGASCASKIKAKSNAGYWFQEILRNGLDFHLPIHRSPMVGLFVVNIQEKYIFCGV